MDARGLRAGLEGTGCTSCGATIPADGIAVLADRGDVAFVELRCTACGSRTMAVVVRGEESGPIADTARHPELDPQAEARLAGVPPLGDEDVAAMARFLEGWQGDLRTLLDRRSDGPGAAS
jgi:hypothetical protein